VSKGRKHGAGQEGRNKNFGVGMNKLPFDASKNMFSPCYEDSIVLILDWRVANSVCNPSFLSLFFSLRGESYLPVTDFCCVGNTRM